MTESVATARLTIDLAAVAANYRALQQMATGSEVAGVVKADAYGLGLRSVSETLWGAGCRRYFVARIDEGIALRSVLPAAIIYVFDGAAPGTEKELLEHRLVPVINTLDQLARWQQAALASGSDEPLPTAIHVDTGMLRLGIRFEDVGPLAADSRHLRGLDLQLVLSHLASADDPGSDQPEAQLARFRNVREILPVGSASLANSAGLFRHPDFRFDLVRPGYALYGGHPQPGGQRLNSQRLNSMKPVVNLEVPVLQIRTAEQGETVGYGAGYSIDRRSRLATIGLGYADGFLRSSSNRGCVALEGQRLPLLGRVSMDLATIDVTDFEGHLDEATMVEVIGPTRTIDDVANDAGTIGYEILTSLGTRFQRRYLGPSDDDVVDHLETEHADQQ